jgi:uncharacterized membrane protein YphA (DoxX/SURF4 family)
MGRLRLALRLLLGAIFIYAAYVKLKDPWIMFAASIGSYELLPDWAVMLVAHYLPWFELLLGLLLASGFALPWTALVTTLQLLAFFSVMLRSYLKGLQIDCGCFGPGEALTWKTLARDGSLAACAILLTILAFRSRRPSSS